jgi:hypothetical protein
MKLKYEIGERKKGVVNVKVVEVDEQAENLMNDIFGSESIALRSEELDLDETGFRKRFSDGEEDDNYEQEDYDDYDPDDINDPEPVVQEERRYRANTEQMLDALDDGLDELDDLVGDDVDDDDDDDGYGGVEYANNDFAGYNDDDDEIRTDEYDF